MNLTHKKTPLVRIAKRDSISTLRGIIIRLVGIVLAVYFGAVGVRRTRHALPACLLADLAGIIAAVAIVNLLFG